MFQKILVPLDGSDSSERAIPVAARLARAGRGSIVFVRVVLPPVDLGKYAAPYHNAVERRECESHKARAASHLAGMVMNHARELMGIEIEFGVAVGLIPQTICSIACKEQVDMIVMCSKGERGFKRWMFGDVARDVAQRSHVPVLVIDEHGTIPRAPSPFYALQMLVALDGSPEAEAALEPSAQLLAALAGPARATLHLLLVGDMLSGAGRWHRFVHGNVTLQAQVMREAEHYLKRMVDRLHEGPLAAFGLIITSSISVGPTAERTILSRAASIGRIEYGSGCTLIALTTHRPRGLRGLIGGGTTADMIGATQLPLFIVPRQRQAVRTRSTNISR